MTRMKTFAGSALAALCVIGVSACGSSDDLSADGATEQSSSADSRLGTMSALDGRTVVDLSASWSKGVGYKPEQVGSEKVNPKGVQVNCTGSGDSLAVSAKFTDGSEFTARRADTAATFRLPGLPEISAVPEGNMLWEGNGIGYDQLTVEAQVNADKIAEIQAAPHINAKFVIACPLA